MRVSTVSRETPHNDIVAEFCELPQFIGMASASDSRRALFRRFITERELKIQPWAKRAGVAEGTVHNFLKGRSDSLTQTSLEKLAAAADATVAELIGEKPREPRAGRDYVVVKGLAVTAALGGGVNVSDEPAGEPFYFRRTWLEQELGSKQASLRVIALKGDSMLPTLNDGDVALIRINEGDPVNQTGIYCLWDGHGLIVKRLQVLPGNPPRLRILSDNRELYPPYEIGADEVRIIGKVIWRGGRLS